MHPILLRIPLPGWNLPVVGVLTSLPIYSYGVMLGLSIVVGWYLTLGLAEKDGLPKEDMANNYVFTALMAILGSRVLYIVTNLDEFKTFGDFFALRRGGLVAYGGFLGGFVGSWLFLRRKHLPLLPWADVAVPSLATGLFLTRIGCYLFGCDFGKPLPAGAPRFLQYLGTFPHWAEGTLDKGTGSPAWFQHYEHHLVGLDSTHSLPVHPTQIYESLVGLALFGLVMLQRRYQHFRGQVFLIFTFGYGFLRYGLEILRDDAERGEYGPNLPEHVLVPGGLLLLGLAYLFFVARAVENPALRTVSQALSLVPALVVYLYMKPPSFADQSLVKLSTSQWVALITGVAAAAAYATFWNAAKAHPEQAMALNLGGVPALSGDPLALGEDEAPAPRRRKKRKPRPVDVDLEAGAEGAPEEKSESPGEALAEAGAKDGPKPAAEPEVAGGKKLEPA